ncbi:MAG: hypothetical protein WCJ37_10705 [Syntrophus sp. (in: bacteria)]
MKRRISTFLLCLLIFCSGTLTAAENKEGTTMAKGQKNKIYQVMWQGENISGQLMINGFTISQFQGGAVTGSAALNIWLTGSNEIKSTINKKDPTASASFSLGVSELVMGDVASTSDRGNLINIELINADLSSQAPKNISEKFNSTMDFSRHLLSVKPPQFKEQEVLDYAIKLYGLFQEKDAKSILQEMLVKTEDYAQAYYQPVANVVKAFSSLLKEDILQNKLVKIDPKKLRAERVNNLWHIYEEKKELIRSKSSDGSTSELPIFIGDINGKLMVVR